MTHREDAVARAEEWSTHFYIDLLEAEPAPHWGPFTNISINGGVILQFAAPPVEIQRQHYAFLVDDAHFDRAYSRLVDHDIQHWADPQMTRTRGDQHRARRPRRLLQRPSRTRVGADHAAVFLTELRDVT